MVQPNEIPNQIDLTRTYPNINGNAFFSAKWFVNKKQSCNRFAFAKAIQISRLPYVVPNSRKQGTEVPLVCISK
jgi:hypothetical protein